MSKEKRAGDGPVKVELEEGEPTPIVLAANRPISRFAMVPTKGRSFVLRYSKRKRAEPTFFAPARALKRALLRRQS